MWLEQLALLYNQAMRNANFGFQSAESSERWRKRCEKLAPILDAEMQAERGRAKWVNGYAIVYPDAAIRSYSEITSVG